MLRLTPKPDASPISIEAFSLLLNDAFAHVTVDRDEGESQRSTHVAMLQRIGAPDEIVSRRLNLEAALVTIEEPDLGEEAYVSFLYFPGEEIIIGFSGHTHEQLGTHVAQRFAAELDYTVSSG